MTAPWYSVNNVEIWLGHVLDVLADLPAHSVQCVATSPPYFGLRSYGTEGVMWGGSSDCDHQLPPESAPGRPPRNHNGQGNTTLQGHGADGRSPYLDAQWDAWQATAPGKVLTGGTGTASAKQVTNAGSQYGNSRVIVGNNSAVRGPAGLGRLTGGVQKAAADGNQRAIEAGATCTRCQAWRGEYGSEPNPMLYTAHSVAVLTALRRVLRPDGVIWWNLGDCYAGSGKGGHSATGIVRDHERRQGFDGGRRWAGSGLRDGKGISSTEKWHSLDAGRVSAVDALKPKDLVGIPWRIAFAEQGFAVVPGRDLADAADILDEARARGDWEAVRGVAGMLRAWAATTAYQDAGWLRQAIIWHKPNPMPESVTDRPTTAHEYIFLLSQNERYYYDAEAIKEPVAPSVLERASHGYSNGGTKLDATRNDVDIGQRKGFADYIDGRNKRSVWTVATFAYPGSHFATWPPKLVEPCVLAGTSARGQCPACGAPWQRVVERNTRYVAYPDGRSVADDGKWGREERANGRTSGNIGIKAGPVVDTTTTGWEQSCKCPPRDPVPQIVLDPFLGSGTTAWVARQHGRRAWGIELNRSYAEQATKRLQQLTLGLEFA